MKIFISYRRSETAEVAGRIFDRLEGRYGSVNVFKDVDSLAPGIEFKEAMLDQVRRSDVVLILIGRAWANVTTENGRRRLDDPDDYVRLETEEALRCGKLVIPVVIGNSSMPSAEQLPASLHPLLGKQATNIRPDPDFRRDVDRLIASFDRGAPPPAADDVRVKRFAWLFSPWSRRRYWMVHGSVLITIAAVTLFGRWMDRGPDWKRYSAFPGVPKLVDGSWMLTDQKDFRFGSGGMFERMFDHSLDTGAVWTFLPNGSLKAGSVRPDGHYSRDLFAKPTGFSWHLEGSEMVIVDTYHSKSANEYCLEIVNNDGRVLNLVTKDGKSLRFFRVPSAATSHGLESFAAPLAFYLGLASGWRLATTRFQRPWVRCVVCMLGCFLLCGGFSAVVGWVDVIVDGTGFLNGPGFDGIIGAIFGGAAGLILGFIQWFWTRRELRGRVTLQTATHVY